MYMQRRNIFIVSNLENIKGKSYWIPAENNTECMARLKHGHKEHSPRVSNPPIKF